MRELIEKFRNLGQQIIDERGPVIFFALIKRQGTLNLWDLVIAARWIGDNFSEPLRYVTDKMGDFFTNEELLKISRVILLEPDGPFVRAFTEAVNMRGGGWHLGMCVISGIEIEEAHILFSEEVQQKKAQ